jgi:hypothetical protein
VGSNVVKSIANGFSGFASTIKSKVTDKINAVKDKVKAVVNKIKGFFPLKIGKIFSNLKVPKINISGGKAPFGIGGLGTKPKISVSWHKKAEENPYLFTKATLFGAGEGTQDEILYGRQALMEDIEEVVNRRQPPQVINNITVNGAEDPMKWAQIFAQQYKVALRSI